MSTIVINDLQLNKALDQQALSTVKGGFTLVKYIYIDDRFKAPDIPRQSKLQNTGRQLLGGAGAIIGA